MGSAHSHLASIDATRLPLERRVRYAFDIARVRASHRDVVPAVRAMLVAEQLAPEQVHHHVMSRQIIADLCRTSEGRRNSELAQLDQRVQNATFETLGSTR